MRWLRSWCDELDAAKAMLPDGWRECAGDVLTASTIECRWSVGGIVVYTAGGRRWELGCEVVGSGEALWDMTRKFSARRSL